jgi:hypothetical protein
MIDWSRHAGLCCGIKEAVYKGGQINLLTHNRSYRNKLANFLYRLKFAKNRKSTVMAELRRLKQANPSLKAVWFEDNYVYFCPQPTVRRSLNYRKTLVVTFSREYTREKERVKIYYYAFQGAHLRPEENDIAEVALVTRQSRLFHGSLLEKGFVNPLSFTNYNSGNKVNLYLKGRVSNVEFE